MKNIQIWTFGPEYGHVMRQIPIVKQLLMGRADIKIQFVCHKSHKDIIKFHFIHEIKEKRVEIIENKYFLYKIAYKPSMDIDVKGTLKNLLKMSHNFPKSLINFTLLKRKFNPDLIISDYMPEVGLYSKFHRLKCIGIYNYISEFKSAKEEFSKILPLVNLISRTFYRTYYMMILEAIKSQNFRILKNKKIRVIPIISRKATRIRKEIRKELGIGIKDDAIFVALGGSPESYHILNNILEIGKNFGDINFVVLPRNIKEHERFKKIKYLHVPKGIVYDTHNYIAACDIVVTKCGFTTVAEALAHKVKILPVTLPHHPEINETEIILEENNIVSEKIENTDTSENIYKKIKKILGKKVVFKAESNGDEIASKIYQQVLDAE